MARATDPGPAPKPKMSGLRFGMMMAFAAFFDLAKFLADFLVIAAPAIVGSAIGLALGKWLGIVAATVTAIVEFNPIVGGAVEALGVLSAIIIAFVGWILFTFWFFLAGINFLNAKNPWRFITYAAGFIVSEIPFVDLIPTFTPTVWYLCHSTRKEDAAKLKAWQDKNDAFQRQQLQERQAYIAQIQGNQALQAQEEEQFEADQIAQMQLDAANDNEEIPEDAVQAA